MPETPDIEALLNKLNVIEETLKAALNILQFKKIENKELNGWVSEAEARRVTGLSRSQLLKMRKEGKLSESSLSVKTPWYKISDFIKLLEENEKKR